jgi:hypothetical protein
MKQIFEKIENAIFSLLTLAAILYLTLIFAISETKAKVDSHYIEEKIGIG